MLDIVAADTVLHHRHVCPPEHVCSPCAQTLPTPRRVELVLARSAQAEEVVRGLHAAGRAVHLVTGGFLPLVEPLAARLGIPPARVHANRLLFTPGGAYAGFDPAQPTARAGGKRAAVAAIKAAAAAAGDGARAVTAVMVGDGATDAEARGAGAADAFVAYGGVARRGAAAAAADWRITDLRALLACLK